MTPKPLDNSRTDIDENVLEMSELNQTNLHLYLGYWNNFLTQPQFQHTID